MSDESNHKSVKESEELFIALVGAVGTDQDLIIKHLKSIFKSVDYKTEEIILSDLLGKFEDADTINHNDEFDRIDKLMTLGNKVRKTSGYKDFLARLAIPEIRSRRKLKNGTPDEPLTKTAFIIKSLKLPEEVLFFRKIYGSAFFVVSIYTKREKRLNNLSRRIAISRYIQPYSKMNVNSEKLMQRDESEKEDEEFGQNVRETFQEADVFVDSSNEDELQLSLRRFVELIFGNSFHNPTHDEFAMFNAFAVSKRSGSLARQVGAVITNQTGEIIATGTNDIPKLGGGILTNNSYESRRYNLQFDTSDQKKDLVLGDLLTKLNKLKLLRKQSEDRPDPNYNEEEIKSLVEYARKELKSSPIMNIIEFVREVHAEMAAIIQVARGSLSADGSLLFTTTFPCHDCTKHIVAAGIKRVIYIESYPKSLSTDLYSDLISVDNVDCDNDKVKFESFVGIAPRIYMDFFTMNKRKGSDGKIQEWIPSSAKLRNSESTYYISKEVNEVTRLEDILSTINQIDKSTEKKIEKKQ